MKTQLIILPEHNIIVSDEEIKEGDWCYHLISKKLKQADTPYHSEFGWKKVIATTDSSLKYGPYPELREDSYYDFPQIPLQFIEEWIVEYNKGTKVENVQVEYEPIGNWRHTEFVHTRDIPKISKDNFISIKRKEKRSYTREEVQQLINSFASYHKIDWLSPITKEWIKHNNL